MACPAELSALRLPRDVDFCCVQASGPEVRRAAGVTEEPAPQRQRRRRSLPGGALPTRRVASAWVRQLARYNELAPPRFMVRVGGPRFGQRYTCTLVLAPDEVYVGRHISCKGAIEAAADLALLQSRLKRPPLSITDLLAGRQWWAGVKPVWEPEVRPEPVEEPGPEWPGPPCRDPTRFGLPRLSKLAGVVPADLPTINQLYSRSFAPLPVETPERVPLHDPRLRPDDPSVRGVHGYAGVPMYVPSILDAMREPHVPPAVPPPPQVQWPSTGLVPHQMRGYAGTQVVLPDGLADILRNPSTPLDFLMRARPTREPPLSWRLYSWFWHGVCFRHEPQVQREALRRAARAHRMAAKVWSRRSNTPPRALHSYGGFGRADAEAEEAQEEKLEREEEEAEEEAEEEESDVRWMDLGMRELCPHGGGEKRQVVGVISEAVKALEAARWAALKLAKARRRQERVLGGKVELEPFGGPREAIRLDLGELQRRDADKVRRQVRARHLMQESRLFADYHTSVPVGKAELVPFGGGEKVWLQPRFYPLRLLDQKIRWEDAPALHRSDAGPAAPDRPDQLDLRFPPSMPVEMEWKLRFGRPTDAVPSGTFFVRLFGVSAFELQDLLPGMVARATAAAPKPVLLDKAPEEPPTDDLRAAIRSEWRRRQLSGCSARSEECGEAELEEDPVLLLRKSSSDRRARLCRRKAGLAVEENGEQVLLFRVGESVFATEAYCPHMKAPLEQAADIESLAEGDCVLRCSKHKFAFNLSRDGRIVFPSHRTDLRLKTYPVKTDDVGHVYVGFRRTHPDLFHPNMRGCIEYED